MSAIALRLATYNRLAALALEGKAKSVTLRRSVEGTSVWLFEHRPDVGDCWTNEAYPGLTLHENPTTASKVFPGATGVIAYFDFDDEETGAAIITETIQTENLGSFDIAAGWSYGKTLQILSELSADCEIDVELWLTDGLVITWKVSGVAENTTYPIVVNHDGTTAHLFISGVEKESYACAPYDVAKVIWRILPAAVLTDAQVAVDNSISYSRPMIQAELDWYAAIVLETGLFDDYPTKAMELSYTLKDFTGSNIQSGDRRFMMAALTDLGVVIPEPTTGDRLHIGTTDERGLSIVDITPLQPGETAIYYEVHTRV